MSLKSEERRMVASTRPTGNGNPAHRMTLRRCEWQRGAGDSTAGQRVASWPDSESTLHAGTAATINAAKLPSAPVS